MKIVVLIPLDSVTALNSKSTGFRDSEIEEYYIALNLCNRIDHKLEAHERINLLGLYSQPDCFIGV